MRHAPRGQRRRARGAACASSAAVAPRRRGRRRQTSIGVGAALRTTNDLARRVRHVVDDDRSASAAAAQPSSAQRKRRRPAPRETQLGRVGATSGCIARDPPRRTYARDRSGWPILRIRASTRMRRVASVIPAAGICRAVLVLCRAPRRRAGGDRGSRARRDQSVAHGWRRGARRSGRATFPLGLGRGAPASARKRRPRTDTCDRLVEKQRPDAPECARASGRQPAGSSPR
jgi:hypothetical protein